MVEKINSQKRRLNKEAEELKMRERREGSDRGREQWGA